MATQRDDSQDFVPSGNPIGEIAAAMKREPAGPAAQTPAGPSPVKPIGEVEAAIERGSEPQE